MKKFIALISTMILASTIIFSASAATITEKQILDELSAGIDVNGQTVKVDSKYVKLATDFFNATDLTDEQLQTIYDDGNTIKETIKSAGVTDLSKLPTDVKSQVLNTIVETGKKVDVAISITKDSVKLVNNEGKTFEIDRTAPIKNTGNSVDAGIIAVITLVVATAAVAIVAKRNKLFN